MRGLLSLLHLRLCGCFLAALFLSGPAVFGQSKGSVLVSCTNPGSFERALRIPAQNGLFSAGHNGARRPVIARIAAGKILWCNDQLDQSGRSEVTGIILHRGSLYAALSTPALPGNSLEKFTKTGWLRTAGRGGKMVTAVLRISPDTGAVQRGTFITGSADDGTAAPFHLTSWKSEGDDLRLTADAGWQPRMKNRIPMACTGKAPFLTTMILRPDLDSVVDAKAERCVCCE